MKKIGILLLLLAILLPVGAEAQRSVKKFYRQFQRNDDVVKLNLPGFLLHLGGGIARNHVDGDEDALLAMELTKYIKGMRLLVVEDPDQLAEMDVDGFVQRLRTKDKFQDLITVREKNTRVHLMMKDSRKKIKNLMILVFEEDEFVMVSLKTSLRYKDLRKFMKIIMERDKIKVTPPKDPQKAIEVVVPRA